MTIHLGADGRSFVSTPGNLAAQIQREFIMYVSTLERRKRSRDAV